MEINFAASSQMYQIPAVRILRETLPLLRHFLYTWSTSSLQWPCQGIHHNNLEQTHLT